MTFEKQSFPEGVMYALIDQLVSSQDYPPYDNCLRLICITSDSFKKKSFNEDQGCETFLLDINLNRTPAKKLLRIPPWFSWRIKSSLDLQRLANKYDKTWLQIKLRHSVNAELNSYGYALFKNAAPTYVDIIDIQFALEQPPLVPVEHPHPEEPITITTPNAPTDLFAFHVGQGMCSVLNCKDQSYLLDAGAGTPLKRDAYHSKLHLHKNALQNDLLPKLHSNIDMILSHPDSDHWRLLDWEPALLKSIKNIYVPNNVANLALSDSSIKPNIIPTKHLQIKTSNGQIILESYRSNPTKDDCNGQCLVSVISLESHCALFPGDYVYERMRKDKNPLVRALVNNSYEAVVVPHHGDKESAKLVVTPSTPKQSKAFFSAGNHLAYHHPCAESLTAHHNKHFKVISKKWIDDIIAVKLL